MSSWQRLLAVIGQLLPYQSEYNQTSEREAPVFYYVPLIFCMSLSFFIFNIFQRTEFSTWMILSWLLQLHIFRSHHDHHTSASIFLLIPVLQKKILSGSHNQYFYQIAVLVGVLSVFYMGDLYSQSYTLKHFFYIVVIISINNHFICFSLNPILEF